MGEAGKGRRRIRIRKSSGQWVHEVLEQEPTFGCSNFGEGTLRSLGRGRGKACRGSARHRKAAAACIAWPRTAEMPGDRVTFFFAKALP
jgi:hypothetical protein